MSDFFKKLNVLVKASLRDVIGDEPTSPSASLTPDRLGKDVDREIESLRQRINEALDFEDELQQRAISLQNQITELDQQADDALAQGEDDTARRKIEDMQRAQQRLAMTEADLRDHQTVTQELILRVNQLEAAVADARRSKTEAAPEQAPAEAEHSPGQMVSDVLRDMREKINQMNDLLQSKDEVQTQEPVNNGAVDDDLSARRDRLSKK
jgi:phage shock protein A